MPFEIVRNDIVNMNVDVIVNTANPHPVIGGGTDAGIHEKAGPQLLEARKKIGSIRPGHCAITPGFGLNARHVIHTVGPVWRGGLFGEAALLRQCYGSALALALETGCRSIAFPLISTGTYGFPKDKALQIAIQVFSEFLTEHEMQIYLVVWSRDVFRLSEKLFRSVASFIDENYIEAREKAEYGAPSDRYYRTARRRRDMELLEISTPMAIPKEMDSCCAAPMAPAPRLDELLAKTDAGFAETLMKLIDQSGNKDSEIYNRANISRQHFSKIRNNPNYKPTKATAIALAIALELDLEQTRDLIGRAGYALTNSSKFDVIIMYFIREGNYNLFDINAALYEFDQTVLG